jgi:hypothetical protein
MRHEADECLIYGGAMHTPAAIVNLSQNFLRAAKKVMPRHIWAQFPKEVRARAGASDERAPVARKPRARAFKMPNGKSVSVQSTPSKNRSKHTRTKRAQIRCAFVSLPASGQVSHLQRPGGNTVPFGCCSIKFADKNGNDFPRRIPMPIGLQPPKVQLKFPTACRTDAGGFNVITDGSSSESETETGADTSHAIIIDDDDNDNNNAHTAMVKQEDAPSATATVLRFDGTDDTSDASMASMLQLDPLTLNMLADGLWSVTDFLCTHVPPSDDGAHLLDWCNLPHMMDYADESIDTESSMHDTSTISWKETSTVFESVTSASADDEDADDESDPSYEDGDAETHALVAHAARMNNGRARRLRMADFRNYRARRVRASEARTKRTITAPDSHVAIESAQQSAAATMFGSSYPSDYTGDGPTGQDVVDTGGELYIVKSKIVGHYYRSALRQYMVAADKKRKMNVVVLLRKVYIAGGAS